MEIIKSLGLVALGVVLALFAGSFGGNEAGTTNYDTLDADAVVTGTLAIGTSGTTLTEVNSGTCYIRPTAATITATTSALVECQANANITTVAALSGVDSGDRVLVQLSTTTAGDVVGGLSVIGATPSSTAWYIMLKVLNLTGATYTWPTSGSASGTAQYIAVE